MQILEDQISECASFLQRTNVRHAQPRESAQVLLRHSPIARARRARSVHWRESGDLVLANLLPSKVAQAICAEGVKTFSLARSACPLGMCWGV
jgi:hypothetical protein